jgi:hypothetical protein
LSKTCHLTAMFGAAALAAVLGSAPASAQDESVRRPSSLRVGPFQVAPTIQIRDVGFDSNVYNDGREVSDFTFTATPTFLATAGTRHAKFVIRSSTDLVYFANETTERSVNQTLYGEGRLLLHRLFMFTGLGYLNTRQRPNEEIDARSRRVTQSAEVGVGAQIGARLVAQVAGRYEPTRFDPHSIYEERYLADALDRSTRSVAGTLEFRATPLTTFAATVDASHTSFDRAPVRDADSERILAGVDLAPRALLAGSVRVGYQRFHPLSALLPQFTGPVGSGAVTYNLRESLQVGGSFIRSIEFSYLQEAPFYVHEGYGMSIRRQLVSRWDVQLEGARFWNRYQWPVAAPAHISFDESFLDAAITVGYAPRSGSRFAVGVGYRDRNSVHDARSYGGLRVDTTITYAF